METESMLLNAARMMDEDALVKIFDLYSTALYKYALRLCGDPTTADHIVGDVFAKLLDQLSAGSGPEANLRSYLYQTAYHELIDEVRYSQRRVSLDMVPWLKYEAGATFHRLEDEITCKQILHAMQNRLTADQRHVIILRFLEGFNLRETAAIMGKRADHVRVIQNRAITTLRESVESVKVRKAAAPPAVVNLSKALGA